MGHLGPRPPERPSRGCAHARSAWYRKLIDAAACALTNRSRHSSAVAEGAWSHVIVDTLTSVGLKSVWTPIQRRHPCVNAVLTPLSVPKLSLGGSRGNASGRDQQCPVGREAAAGGSLENGATCRAKEQRAPVLPAAQAPLTVTW